MTENNQNGESRIRKVLFNEVALFAGIIGILFGVFNYIYSPNVQQDSDLKVMETLNNLRDNHINTLENDVNDIKKSISEIQGIQIRIETILNERLPAKK